MVDDFSDDNTLHSLQSFSHHPQVRILTAFTSKRYKSSKKNALEQGIRKARGELIVLTDADCAPPPDWVKTMVAYIKADTALVAGFSPQTAKSRWLNGIYKCDSLAAAFVAAGGMGHGHGITCTGRNLAYRKSVFEEIDGFKDVPDSLSGDDDFILQKMAQLPSWRITYAIHPQAGVPAKGPETLRGFFRQKQRHISAGKHFRRTQQVGYGVFHLCNALLWLAPVVDLFWGTSLWMGLAAKVVFDILILRWFAGKFHISLPLYVAAVWEVVFLAYNAISGVLAFTRRSTWK